MNCTSAGKWMRSGGSSRVRGKRLTSRHHDSFHQLGVSAGSHRGSHRNTPILLDLVLTDINVIRHIYQSVHRPQLLIIMTLSKLYRDHLFMDQPPFNIHFHLNQLPIGLLLFRNHQSRPVPGYTDKI